MAKTLPTHNANRKLKKNPPAPKVPTRGSLAASDTNGPICQSGTASAGAGRLLVRPSRPTSFLSVLFPGHGWAVLFAKRLEYCD